MPPSQSARILRDRVKWKIATGLHSLGEGLASCSAAAVKAPADRLRRKAVAPPAAPLDLPGELVRLRPDRFVILNSHEGLAMLVFDAEEPADFDWMEHAIIDNGYYEAPHVWPLRVDRDKRVMAEIVASLNQGGRVLELGCASGAVLEGLALRGIEIAGVDISHRALARASRLVRDHIHLGDILTLDLRPGFDTIYGLDVFEHLNPNRLDQYLERLHSLLVDGGLLFANIPGFGVDEIYGEIFPRYLPEWDVDAQAGTPFRHLHVDQDGYPIHGHLIWAESKWWVDQFVKAGFLRCPIIETALHRKYDDHMTVYSPARKSFYVFASGRPEESKIAARIAESPSFELMTLRRVKTLGLLWR